MRELSEKQKSVKDFYNSKSNWQPPGPSLVFKSISGVSSRQEAWQIIELLKQRGEIEGGNE